MAVNPRATCPNKTILGWENCVFVVFPRGITEIGFLNVFKEDECIFGIIINISDYSLGLLTSPCLFDLPSDIGRMSS